jgi:hypothetical protein
LLFAANEFADNFMFSANQFANEFML